MKNSLLATVSFIAIGVAGSASAQSLTAFDWSGPYVGATVAFTNANYSGTFQGNNSGVCVYSSCVDFTQMDLSGIGAGVHAGYNWQVPNGAGPGKDLVYGIEADAIFAAISGEKLARAGSDGGVSGSVDLLASVRGRVGVAFNRTLVYGTAGIAFNNAGGATFESQSSADTYDKFAFSNIGGVVGAGVEYAVTDTFSIRGEALYYVFNETIDISSHGSASSRDRAVFNDALSIRLGGSFKF